MKKNKKYQLNKFKFRYCFFLIPISVFIFYALFFTSSKKVFVAEKRRPKEIKVVENVCKHRSRINGICVNSEESDPTLVGVMIENHPSGRPQAGLAQASVVYEALVEGNYTRFLALYPAASIVNKVGPVRSARSYFLDWLIEWGNPLYMHVGGSPEALETIQTSGIFDANEFYHGGSYWREPLRSPPHNVYTNFAQWTELWQRAPIEFFGWEFVTSSTPCLLNCVQNIRIPYSSHTDVRWNFNTSSGQFIRYYGDVKHSTEEGENVADTIIIQEVKIKVIDDNGRLSLKTIGQGLAAVLYDGKKIVGTWKKESLKSRTRFYDEAGTEIFLKPGKIWIEIIPNFSVIEFTQL